MALCKALGEAIEGPGWAGKEHLCGESLRQHGMAASQEIHVLRSLCV